MSKDDIAIDQSLLIRSRPLRSGRNLIVTPERSCMRYLSYGRISLDEHTPTLELETGNQEFNLIVLKGSVRVACRGEEGVLEPYDSLYVPRDERLRLENTGSSADLAECAAPVSRRSRPQIIRFRELQDRHPLHMRVGGEGYSRDVYQFVGPQVEAFRLLTGITFGKPGNWTGFPPHRHEETREEIYLYIELPPPGFGVQFIYRDPTHVDFAEMVRQDDAVLLPAGYHPNVAAPGFGLNYVWMMAAFREVQDREWAEMEWQEDLKKHYS